MNSKTFAYTLLSLAILASVPGHTAEAPAAPVIADGDLLIDASMTDQERSFVHDSLAQAQARIVQAYGTREAPSTQVVWCKSRECAVYYGGDSTRSYATAGSEPPRDGATATFDRPTIVILRQVRVRPGAPLLAIETMTHELSHREFQARLRGARVPSWFNEGVATLLGGEHPCTPDMHGTDDLHALVQAKAWHRFTEQNNTVLVTTYCQARNEVASWIDAHGGFGAVIKLLNQVASGTPFERAYRR